MVERCLPNRFPTWRTRGQPESRTCARPSLYPAAASLGWASPRLRQPIRKCWLSPALPSPPPGAGLWAGFFYLQVGDQKQDPPDGEHGHGQEEHHRGAWNNHRQRWVVSQCDPNTEPQILAPTCSKFPATREPGSSQPSLLAALTTPKQPASPCASLTPCGRSPDAAPKPSPSFTARF